MPSRATWRSSGVGSRIAPDLAVGDGALGFWKATEEVPPGTRRQHCGVPKTANGRSFR